MTIIQPKAKPPAKPPGDIPSTFMTGSMMFCSELIRESESNKISIIGTFNNLHAKTAFENIDLDLPVLPGPVLNCYIRILCEGTRSFNWALYQRVLTWNGRAESPDAVALVAHGDTQMAEANHGMGELSLLGIAVGFKLTPDRKRDIRADTPLPIGVRYEFWIDEKFLLAHSIDFTYTFATQAPHDVNTDISAAGPGAG
jgi:hypothetical protein